MRDEARIAEIKFIAEKLGYLEARVDVIILAVLAVWSTTEDSDVVRGEVAILFRKVLEEYVRKYSTE